MVMSSRWRSAPRNFGACHWPTFVHHHQCRGEDKIDRTKAGQHATLSALISAIACADRECDIYALADFKTMTNAARKIIVSALASVPRTAAAAHQRHEAMHDCNRQPEKQVDRRESLLQMKTDVE